MDESKEKELEGVNVTESVVTVNSVVTTTETVIKKAVTCCEVEESCERVGVSEKELTEKDGGPCEVGDVMVEILGSEVIVDGVRRESGEMGGDELGHRNGDLGTVNDDGEVCSGRGVKHAINCQDEGLDTLPDDSGLCAEGNDTSLANFASQDCNICDVDNEKTIEVAVEGDIVRQLGDAGEKKDVELPNNAPELYEDSNPHIVKGKSNDIGDTVLHSVHTITLSSDEKMDLDDEESLEALKRTREQDSHNEGDHQAASEAGADGRTTVLEDETVNGGISSVGASITRAKRISLGCSVDVNVFGETDPENPIILKSNYDSSDLHTQIDRIDHMDGANESIPVPESDTLINSNVTKDGPQFVENEKSNDTFLPARVGSENGTVDDMKVHRTGMEIDAASGSVIHSENQLVDMNENDEDIENNVITSLSKAPVVESLVIEMNIDASDPVSLKQCRVCEAPHDDLKSNSDTQEPGADENTKESDPIESVTTVKQYVEAVGKIENIVEHLSTCSPVLDATDDSGAEGVIQEPECKANAFHVDCLDSHTTDGVAEIGPHMENVQKLQEVMHSELVAVDYASPNENHNAKVLQPVRLDAGGDEKAVLKVLDEEVSLINALTNEEDKTIKLAGSLIPSIENVTEVGSNMEAAREVQQVLSTDPVVFMDNSNMEGREEVQEEAVSAEEAVYMNNEAPNEDETPKQHNHIPSAAEGTHGETCRLDENVIVGPFVVETEDSGDTVVGREYVGMDSGPMHDGIGNSDSHALEMPHSPRNPLDERLVIEAADHDAKTDSDMEDAQDKGEPGNAQQAEEQQSEEQVSLINDLTNEDKTIELAGSKIPSIENVTEVGSNMEAAREVQQGFSTDPVVLMDNNSNMEGMEDVQEEVVSAEEAVYMNNEAPNEDEIPKQHNHIPSATEGTHGETCRLDEKVIAGPFVVETEDSGDTVVGREYVDMDSGPMHDGTGNSDSHAFEMPHSPSNPLDERLVIEAADHDAKSDSDMEDAQDKGEPGNAQQAEERESEEQVSLINDLTNEDKTIELAGSLIPSIENVTEVGSNMEAAREVQQVFSTDPVVLMDNNSNMEGMEDVQEEVVSAEEAVYMNNEAPNEDETPKQHNHIPSATEGTHGETCRLDENVIVGPFVVETEDSGDTIVGVDMDSSPIHDGIENSDSHAFEMPHSPSNPLDERLVVEAADHDAKTDSYMEDAQDKGGPDNSQQAEEQESDEEHVSTSAKSQNKEKNINAYRKSESLLKDHRVSYQLPLEIEGEFSVTNLVWGKVKSHPWWPGQIFHPSDSSEKAMKYFRKDCYLVAYFGDRTFAWNEASVLKPFRNHFSVAERQNKTEAFQNAVNCALAEVSRRMELGLACSCVSQQAYEKIRYQMVENTGIREESSKRVGADRCSGLEYFQPDKLVEYIRSLAIFPTGSVDRLELVIAKAHLVAFLRLKGIDCLSDYRYYEGISGEFEHEDSATRFDSKNTPKGSKRKHNLKDIVYQRREKSMSELMGETMYYLDSEFDSHEEDDNMLTSPSIKRKASGFNDFTSQPATKTISVAKVSNKASHTPQQSFKVGECIQRVASQLTGSSLLLKSGSDGGSSEHLGDAVDDVVEASYDCPTETSPSPSHESSLEEMLSQLHLFAQDPMKGYNFLGEIVGFFEEFRNLAVSNQRQRMRKGPGKKRKSSTPVVGTPETFEFDDRNDSYWRDMVVQNNAEAKPSRRGRKRKDEQGLSVDSEKPSQSKPRKSSKKQYFHGSLGSTAETSSGDKERLKQLPTELLLNFTGMGSIPSEINLNKMFRCFGPLKESETEIDVQSSRARVVFKKRSDAEVAYSSAAMFNIFGSTLVNYQLNYTPSNSFKTCPLELADGQEKAA